MPPIIFKPNGSLNISDAPTDISDTDFSRCKNLSPVKNGEISTRHGSSRVNLTAIDVPSLIVENNSSLYEFSDSNIYKNENSIASTTTTQTAWSAIKYSAFNETAKQIFALNGTERKRIDDLTVSEWGIDAPTIAPTVATGALTGITGVYAAKYSYVRKVGATLVSESNLSPVSSQVTLTNQSLSVTATAPSDSQVTHIRFYRSFAGGSLYFFDQDIEVGSTSIDTNATDANLGDAEATNHNRPPLGTFVIGPNFNGTCFILKDNNLHYCLPKQPEYWPLDFFIEISSRQFPCVSAVFHNGQLHVLTTQKIYYIQGTGSGSFFPVELASITGTQSPYAVETVHGRGIYHVGNDGIYLFSGVDKKVSHQAFSKIFEGKTINGIPAVVRLSDSMLRKFNNSLYFAYSSSGDNYPSNIIVLNFSTNRAAYYQYSNGVSPVQFRSMGVDNSNDRLLIGEKDGYIRHIESISSVNDDSVLIDWELQSKDFTNQTRKHFPRWAKYDVSGDASGSVILDDSIIQSHSSVGSRNTKRRLIREQNGNRLATRVSGSGVATIYQVEME